MPTVPVLESPQVQQEALPGRALPRIDDHVDAAAFGAPLAAGLEAASASATEEQAKQKVQNDTLRVIDANTQLEAGRNALLYGKAGSDGTMTGGAFSLHGLDAMNLPAKLTPAYQSMADSIGSTLTPDQRRLFQPHIAAGTNELNLQLNRYEFTESNHLADAVYTNAGKQAVESASVGWRDPSVIGKSRADIKALVQLQGDRQGWGEDQRDANTRKLLGEMHFSVVDRMLGDGNPQAALGYFVGTKAAPGIRDSDELTGEQAHQIGSAIDAAIRQQGTQIETQVAAKVRDVRTAAVNGQLIPPSSMPSDTELRAAYPSTWQDVKGAISRDVQMGADLKGMAALPPDQLAAEVEHYRPSSVLGASEGYERFNAVAAAAARTVTDRARDPRQYAIDNKLGSTPLQFSDQGALGDELRARLASTPALSRQLGGYVPPLTKDEAARLSQSLETQTPTDRLRSLNSLNSAVQDDRGFQEIMRQVLPGSPVTAIVGAQLSAAHPKEPPVWFDPNYAANPADQVRILAGEQLINPQGKEKAGEPGGKKAFPMPPDGGLGGLREQFATSTGDLFRGRPELGEAYYTAFKGAYASLLSDRGDLSGNGNTKLRDQALSMAVGHLTDFHGGQIAAPQGMDPARFPGLLEKAVANEALKQGAPPNFEDALRGYTVREVGGLGSGRYELYNGNALLVRPDGKGIFQVDVRSSYLMSRGAQGSPEDIARSAAGADRPQPSATGITGGTANVPRDVPRETTVKPPAVSLGGRGRGGPRAHPSQGEAPDL